MLINLNNKIKNNFNKNILDKDQIIYAGFMVRFFATLIDMVITAPLIWASFYIVGLDLSSMLTMDQILSGEEIKETTTQKVADFLSWIISIAYSIYFLTSKNQATPGKRMMNIYVATKDGQKLSINRCFARFFCTVLSGVLLGAGFLMIIFTKEKTALHDMICGTRVFHGKK